MEIVPPWLRRITFLKLPTFREWLKVDEFTFRVLTECSTSFKRKQKAPTQLALPKFLRPLETPSQGSGTSTPQFSSSRIRQLREQSSRNGSDISLAARNGHAAVEQGNGDDAKEGGPLDWYGDGPRRRVGYDDLTAIDWIFEYTKERQRLRMLYSRATGILGQLNQLWDASQVWLILIATGGASGILAAGINIVSDWLGDLKLGFCYPGQGGGRFYLSKGFCCLGYEKWADCLDWTPWSTALHVNAPAGRYVIEYFFFIASSVIFAASASLLVREYAAFAKHSGVPEIKTVLGGFVIRRFMGAWTLITKCIGLCLAVSSGLWLGKEGPLVHVACCCANLFMKLSKSINENEARKREVLSAAASAGISVAFGSPIGGVLFSLEQLSYYFPDKTMWQSFVCAMVAAVSLQVMNPFRTDQLVLYQVRYSSSYHGFELVPFAFLGIIGGLYGALFIKLNMRIATWRRSSRIIHYPLVEVLVVTAITAIVNFPNKFMRAQSSELVHILFAECKDLNDDIFGICETGQAYGSTIALLLMAAALGFVFASITFGLQIPAGIILPSMAIGALYGRVVGIFVQLAQTTWTDSLLFINCEPDRECVTPGTYAIVGAASALGGVTRMTVSIVVIMFELTGALTYVLPIMIAVMLSKWVGDAFGKKGIYESWIHFNEYPFLENRDDNSTPDVPAAQVMTPVVELASISSVGHTLQSLQEFLSKYQYRGFPVVADLNNNILLGYITRIELSYAIKSSISEPRSLPLETPVFFSHQPHADPVGTVDFRPWMDQTPITLNSKATLQLTVDMFLKLGLKYVLFLEKGALQGLLTKKDVWYVLNNAGEDDTNDAAMTPRSGRAGEERGFLVTPLTPGEGMLYSPFDLR